MLKIHDFFRLCLPAHPSPIHPSIRQYKLAGTPGTPEGIWGKQPHLKNQITNTLIFSLFSFLFIFFRSFFFFLFFLFLFIFSLSLFSFAFLFLFLSLFLLLFSLFSLLSSLLWLYSNPFCIRTRTRNPNPQPQPQPQLQKNVKSGYKKKLG